jgi:hypothetical protein
MAVRPFPPFSGRMLRAALVCWPVLLVNLPGCQAPPAGEKGQAVAAAPRKRTHSKQPPIRRVRCLYEQKPWLNLDKAGDRDPEGIRYRIFLDPDTGRGVLREGTFHIELYRIDRVGPDQVERTLASDWHYPTSAVHRIAKPGMLGEGYFVHLVWAEKDIAGHEIELITWFEDPEGMKARSGTKRLRVPKYTP